MVFCRATAPDSAAGNATAMPSATMTAQRSRATPPDRVVS